MGEFAKWLMMREDHDAAALTRAIKANPKDTLAWKAYADWFEESGDQGRADLIRQLVLLPRKTGQDLAKADNLWLRYGNGEFASVVAKAIPAAAAAIRFSSPQRRVSLSKAAAVMRLVKRRYDNSIPNVLPLEIASVLGSIREWLDGQSIQGIRGNNVPNLDHYGNVAAFYINLGDENSTTVIYNVPSNRLEVASLADWVRRNRNAYGINT